MQRIVVAIATLTVAIVIAAAARASSEYPREAPVLGSVIQLLSAANGGKPALVIRCASSGDRTCPSEIVVLIDHPDADHIRVGDHVDVIATFDSPYSYHGVGGEEVRATIYKFRARSKRPNQAMQRTASKAATDVLRVCHPPVGCVARFPGLAVADLVSR
jgi:hypothetical protein